MKKKAFFSLFVALASCAGVLSIFQKHALAGDGGIVTFTIIDGNANKPLVGAMINITKVGDKTRILAQANSDRNGVAKVRLQSSGEYSYHVTYGYGSSTSAKFTYPGGDVQHTIRLVRR